MLYMKTLIFHLLILVSVIAGCSSPKTDPYNPWNIADNDTISLAIPRFHAGIVASFRMPGFVFKAINPRFIANAYGVKEIYDSDLKSVHKEFELVGFDNYLIPNYYDSNPLTTLNVRKKWNYYINDILAMDYSRVLVSAFLLQSFERVEYIASDSTAWLGAIAMPIGSNTEDNPSDKYLYEMRSRDGAIRVYIRNISQSVINDKATLYLINGRVVTRKIYEAINPVYIRSLKRITNQSDLTEYKQKKNIKEVVEVELFTYEELNSNIMLSILDDCPECDVYIVDNVQIDSDIYDALRSIFYKSVRVISEKDKEAFAPYRKLFPEKKFEFGDKRVTIISL